DGKLTRIDPLSNQVVTSIPVGIEPGFVTFAGDSAWVSMDGEPTIVRVSAASNTVTARVGVAGGNWGIAGGSNAVWSVQTMTVAGIPVTPGYLTRISF
ncbi:MAG TPA: hypothetical protein VFV33_10965, partial [Gemmatimonadaceae bacterium]|nr:hypothetical protein [Gemmatimonadaceae bacterium]